MDETTVKALIRAKGIGTTDISDANLDTVFHAALNEYSSYRPMLKFTLASGYLTTVANQTAYAFPTGATAIYSVFWNPDYSDSYLGDLYTDLITEHMQFGDALEVIMDYDKIEQMRRYFSGTWKVMYDDAGVRKIFLLPTPSTAGTKIAVVYATVKTITDLNEIEDQNFYQLIYGLCLEVKAQTFLSQGSWRAGAYSVTASAGDAFMNRAEKVLNNVRHKLAMTGGSSAQKDFPNTHLP